MNFSPNTNKFFNLSLFMYLAMKYCVYLSANNSGPNETVVIIFVLLHFKPAQNFGPLLHQQHFLLRMLVLLYSTVLHNTLPIICVDRGLHYYSLFCVCFKVNSKLYKKFCFFYNFMLSSKYFHKKIKIFNILQENTKFDWFL